MSCPYDFSCIHLCSLTFVPIIYFGDSHLWWQLTCDDMATGFDAPCHLHFFCCHAAFDIWATTWQLKLIQHGNCSCCHMANTVHYTWQLDLPRHVACIFCFHAAFFHMAITWQMELTQHGKCSCCDMATTVQLDGNYSATTWQL